MKLDWIPAFAGMTMGWVWRVTLSPLAFPDGGGTRQRRAAEPGSRPGRSSTHAATDVVPGLRDRAGARRVARECKWIGTASGYVVILETASLRGGSRIQRQERRRLNVALGSLALDPRASARLRRARARMTRGGCGRRNTPRSAAPWLLTPYARTSCCGLRELKRAGLGKLSSGSSLEAHMLLQTVRRNLSVIAPHV